MKVFWHAAQLKHAPRFFLTRGQTRPNFEVPARAEALLASCQAMRLDIVTPRPADRAALLTVHDPSYLDFLRDAHADWSALPDTGEEVVANSHPSPEMRDNGARMPAHIIGRTGWFTADAACPIGPHTWNQRFGPPPAPSPRRMRRQPDVPRTRWLGRPVTTRIAPAPAVTATSTTPRWRPNDCARRARTASRCSTSTATTATARRTSSGAGRTCCSSPCTATQPLLSLVHRSRDRARRRPRRRLQPKLSFAHRLWRRGMARSPRRRSERHPPLRPRRVGRQPGLRRLGARTAECSRGDGRWLHPRWREHRRVGSPHRDRPGRRLQYVTSGRLVGQVSRWLRRLSGFAAYGPGTPRRAFMPV